MLRAHPRQVSKKTERFRCRCRSCGHRLAQLIGGIEQAVHFHAVPRPLLDFVEAAVVVKPQSSAWIGLSVSSWKSTSFGSAWPEHSPPAEPAPCCKMKRNGPQPRASDPGPCLARRDQQPRSPPAHSGRGSPAAPITFYRVMVQTARRRLYAAVSCAGGLVGRVSTRRARSEKRALVAAHAAEIIVADAAVGGRSSHG